MFERNIVAKLKERILEKRRFIQIIVGPRQSGKTTVIKQVLKKIPYPKHYVSADRVSIDSEWIIREWNVARALQKNAKKDTLLVIDEIQKIPHWSTLVKRCYDEDSMNDVGVKVILTGSSTLLLQKGLNESLMGRFELLFNSHWNYLECKKAFGYTMDDFLFFGGYPGAAAFKEDEYRWADYILNSIVEPTISQDILLMEEIRKPALLRSLFTLGSSYSAREVSYTKLLGQLQNVGNTVTLAHYLNLLEKANILCGLPKFSLNKLKLKGSTPRFMVFDTSLMTYAEGKSKKNLLSDSNYKGHLVESSVGAYLLSRSKKENFNLYYWRERGNEVDFVLQKGKEIIAIEVKSGKIKNTKGIIEFKNRFPSASTMIIGDKNNELEDFLLGKTKLF